MPVLIAFGDLESVRGRIAAPEIASRLLGEGIWYLPRISRQISNGDSVIFYENGAGARAFAVIESCGRIDSQTRWLLDAQLRSFFHMSMTLRDVVTVEAPVLLKPLVNELGFIANKVHWGHSLRGAPRRISQTDFDVIRNAACTAQPAHRIA